MGKTHNKTQSHRLHILQRLYNGERLTSFDLGTKMVNPNQYFCKLKKEGLIDEITLPSGVKVRFILPQAKERAKALLNIQDSKITEQKRTLFDYHNDFAAALTNGKGIC
ncbi:MAG: hypothetical protein LBQ18_00145 [Campylobacteraceae bacterium]|jgi:hypothetical protein|nr:hypothetical protein [Campylobacteraceae bacterium]